MNLTFIIYQGLLMKSLHINSLKINKNHKKYLKNLRLNKVLFVKGGKTRADSAKNCLDYLLRKLCQF